MPLPSFTPSPVVAALAAGTVAAAATAAGTVPALFMRRGEARANDALFGFGAGVMLAASTFSLLLPALRNANLAGAGPWGAGMLVSAALLAGAMAVVTVGRTLPHWLWSRAGAAAQGHDERVQRAWLFVFAICLHNLPEGLSIGVGYAGRDMTHGTTLALAIAIQDIPEGLVVALALFAAGYRRGPAVAVGMASGLIEPVGAVIGVVSLLSYPMLLPAALGAAAGAMLFVVCHEIIPESHLRGAGSWATGGLLSGFVLMMMLDTALG
jgi:ZIP family zinc transporter